MVDNAAQRDQFEAWASTQGFSQEPVKADADGIYPRVKMAIAWNAWQAALASRPAVQQEGWTDAQILKVAGEWFVTGENQHFSEGYRYRSLGVPSNVQESHLVEFGRAMVAAAPPATNLSPATPRPEDVSQKAGKDATYWHDRYCTEKKERKDWQERAELAEKALIDKKLEEKP